MFNANGMAQLRYLEETAINLARAGFDTGQIEERHLPVGWNGNDLCQVSCADSVRYRRQEVEISSAQEKLQKVIDIAKATMEYMTMLEQAPQLQAEGLEGDYRILANFGDAVLAGHPTAHGVQFVTWEWDQDGKGVHTGHYYQGDYRAAKLDFAARAGLIPKERLFTQEQLFEIYRCCADSGEGDLYDLSAEVGATIRGVQDQIRECLPNLDDLIQQEIEKQEQDMTI